MPKCNWKIKLENIGRGKICRSIDIQADTLPQIERRAVKECSLHLMSHDVGLVEKTDLTYTVIAGCRSVGHVKIVSI